ncbi:MAG: tryptophan--tRNA ligase [Chloroflexota bacterium]|nr:tryptophan--tRNA ligase [Chloroflexota bacterium]MDE2941234.1 tryptophan--tRNA ligase [Chloroflexota bacterium]MDE3267182.1 tryptophan--tRNA ligase [Chloroflexota bacterium]
MTTGGHRVFSGMRPSGRLHVGNYVGALQNWVAMQDEFECIYCAVDVHALTDMQGEDTREIRPNVREMVLDWLAAGIDPDRSLVFAQSQVPEVMVLHTLLSMVTPLGWLMRVPTFKDKVRQMQETEESVSYGLVGYPVLMTADIILYKADTVPVGEDQLPHLELAREIARRFNHLYGPTFPEPQARLTEVPLVVGLDGAHKMSKSLDNHIELAASPEETTARIATAFTDPERLRRSDPGRPWVCNVYSLHKLFNPGRLDEVYQGCTSAQLGCVEDKRLLADGVNENLAAFRERRSEFESRPGYVEDALREGARRAQAIARETLAEVQERLGLASVAL